MDFTYNKNTDILKFICPNCNAEIEYDCSTFTSESYINPLGEDTFKNLVIDCQCGATNYFNMMLPESDYDELDIEEYSMSYAEINMRKELRDLMWKKREDLKEMNRDTFNEERLKELPVQIQNLIKRNNIVTMLTGNLNLNSMLNDEQTEILKTVAMNVVIGQISILQAIAALTQYFKQGTP